MTHTSHRWRSSLAGGFAAAALGAGSAVLPASAAVAAPPLATAAVPGCTGRTTHVDAPVAHASQTYSAGTAGTVTIQRGAGRGLTITSTAPASGYRVRVVTERGRMVKVTFYSPTSHTIFTAHLGNTDTTLLAIHTSVC